MHAQISEVSLKFRAAYVFAAVAMLALWPIGMPYGVVGLIFGIGLLVLTSILSMPRSVDLMFGMMVTLFLFAAQFLGAVFIGIEIGANVTPMVLSCVGLWFTQLAMFGWDLHRYASPVVLSTPGPNDRVRRGTGFGDDDFGDGGSGDGPSGPGRSPQLTPEETAAGSTGHHPQAAS